MDIEKFKNDFKSRVYRETIDFLMSRTENIVEVKELYDFTRECRDRIKSNIQRSHTKRFLSFLVKIGFLKKCKKNGKRAFIIDKGFIPINQRVYKKLLGHKREEIIKQLYG